MYRNMVAGVLACLAFSSHAADWQLVAETKLGTLKLDKASIVQEGQYKSVQMVYEFKDLQRLTAPPNSVFNRREDELLVDCAHSSLGMRSNRFFEDAQLKSAVSKKTAEVQFIPLKPDTMVETVVKAVCEGKLAPAAH